MKPTATHLRALCAIACLVTRANLARAEHQTATVSPITVGGAAAFDIEIVEYDFGAADFPTLHSYAAAEHNGLWVFIAGRTNGLHGMGFGGSGNFPVASQNRDVWVIDPINKLSWNRSLEDAASGLTTAEVDSITVTNNQFYQHGDRLYMTGGYGYDRGTFRFLTYDVLTAVDLPGIIGWAQGGAGAASDHIRQLSDPLFRVTGGAMYRIGAKTHLVFGQDYDSGYNPLQEGTYTQQVRTFEITDDGTTLGVANVVQTAPTAAFRRRDLNVLPRIVPSGGELDEALVVLSGVFTLTNGGWTVPVEIDANGTPSMSNPASAGTFKQGMNNYHSAKISLFSESSETTHMLIFGGISLQFYDRDAGEFVTDDLLPFINQATDISIDASGAYAQRLLPVEFPEILDGGNRLRFGANAEFLVANGITTYDNGVVQLDAITGQTTIGYIVGGIAADAGNNGNSHASGRIFEVIFTPVSPLLADFDNDWDVDGDDFLLWQSGFGTGSGASKSDGDADGDGDVDGDDFLIWQAEFGSTLGGAAAGAVATGPVAVATNVTATYGRWLKRKATSKSAPRQMMKRR